MVNLRIHGEVASKIAMHVPVIRRWRLVWERRELGTRLDRVDRNVVLDWPPEGGVVPLFQFNDWAAEAHFGTRNFATIKFTYQGQPVDLLTKNVNLRRPGTTRVNTTIWKGVWVNLTIEVLG